MKYDFGEDLASLFSVVEPESEPEPVPSEQELPLHHLALVFGDDDHLSRSARQFLKSYAESRDLDPDLFNLWSYLDEVWPDGVPNTFYLSNIGNDPHAPSHFLNMLIRPVAEGPRAERAAVGGLTLALEVQRRQGRLDVRRVEVAPHVQRRDFEVLVSSPVYWRDHEIYMDNSEMALLARLPFHRAKTRERLLTWRKYLEWKEKLIEKNQVSIPYRAARWEGETTIAFLVDEDELPARKLVGMELGVAPYAGDDEDDGDDGQRRRRRRRPKITEVGEVEFLQILNLRDKRDREGWGELKLTDKDGRVGLRVEEEQAEILKRRGFPEEGLLMSSIIGDLAPLFNQRSGVDRLNNSQGFSPRLADFIFSSTSASVPLEVPEELPPVEGGRELNAGQRQAVAKALTAPDLCLIQGPPGTGKTTVIADICLRAALRGQRVLVASQTNLAVDNALARLSDAPAVRPLRLGNPDRVDEEFKHFLAENVIERWFVSIAEQCRVRMDAAQNEAEMLAAREAAVVELESLLTKLVTSRREVTRAEQGVGGCREARDRARQQFERARQEESDAKAEQDRLMALAEWGSGERTLPPTEVGRALPVTVFPPSGLDRSLPLLVALERHNRQRDSLGRVLTHLDEATVGSASDPEAAAELRQLREEKFKLIDSDEMDDLRRLRTVNRRIKELEGSSGWNKITGELGRAARLVWPGALPPPISVIVEALKPSTETRAALAEARKLVRDQLDLAEAAAFTMQRASETWLEAATTLQDKVEQCSRQKALRRGEVNDAEGSLDKAIEHQTKTAREHEALQTAWREAWRRAVPSEAVQPESEEALRHARSLVEEARQGEGERLARADRWRDVQGEWMARLGKVTDSDREQIQALYIRRSNVVGMTCNEAGKRKTWQDSEFQPFDIVIVDEVSKATPPELILPMLLGEKAILVGDHRQLPPMFRERDASFGEATENGEVTKEDYERFKKMVTASLFEELFEQAPEAIKAMLWTQYRMHPTVMAAINQFYEDRLEAGPDEVTLAGLRQHHLEIRAEGGGRLLSPQQNLLWVDSSKGADGKPHWEEQAGSSKVNMLEVYLVADLLIRIGESLVKRGYGQTYEIEVAKLEEGATWRDVVEAELATLPAETIDDLFTERRVRVDGRAQQPDAPARAGVRLRVNARKEVGVITFYGAQLREIRTEIDRCRSKNKQIFAAMELRTNTVDRFQGMEKPIILCSLVRAKRGKLGDFVREYQRINVGLSRAQQLLVIIGAEETWKNALVPLPPVDGGPAVDVPAYRNILELARRSGGRRVARQVIFP